MNAHHFAYTHSELQEARSTNMHADASEPGHTIWQGADLDQHAVAALGHHPHQIPHGLARLGHDEPVPFSVLWNTCA